MFVHNILKGKIAPFTEPFARQAYEYGLTPHRATFVSILFKIASILLIIDERFFLAGLAVVLDYAFDILDGTIARTMRLESTAGYYIDLLSDAIFRTLWYPALVLVGELSPAIVIVQVSLVTVLVIMAIIIARYRVPTTFPVFFLAHATLIPGFFLNMIAPFALATTIIHAFFLAYNCTVLAVFSKKQSI